MLHSLTGISSFLTFFILQIEHDGVIQGSSTLFNKHANTKFSGVIGYTINVRSGLECCIACLNSQTVDCKAVNFDKTEGTCELLQDTTGTLEGYFAWSRIMAEQAECPAGWLQFETKCYIPYKAPRNWDSALSFCQTLGGTLANLQSREIFDFLTYELRTTVSFTRYWIGARDYNGDNLQYQWMDGSTLIDYGGWYPNEPNGLTEECVELKNINGVYNFNDQSCSRTYNFICETSLN